MVSILKQLYEDAKNICDKDPACRNLFEAIILYPGFHAIFFHRMIQLLQIYLFQYKYNITP